MTAPAGTDDEDCRLSVDCAGVVTYHFDCLIFLDIYGDPGFCPVPSPLEKDEDLRAEKRYHTQMKEILNKK
jgi:hypothetical protein